jgi:hypothetical protein
LLDGVAHDVFTCRGGLGGGCGDGDVVDAVPG